MLGRDWILAARPTPCPAPCSAHPGRSPACSSSWRRLLLRPNISALTPSTELTSAPVRAAGPTTTLSTTCQYDVYLHYIYCLFIYTISTLHSPGRISIISTISTWPYCSLSPRTRSWSRLWRRLRQILPATPASCCLLPQHT